MEIRMKKNVARARLPHGRQFPWVFLLLAALFTLPSPAQEKGSITVAQVGPVDGPIGFYTRAINDGISAFFGWVNSRGGIRGHRLELLLEDTPLDPQRTLEKYTQIARLHKPVAFVYPMSPTVIDALLDANIGARLGVPIIGTIPQMYRRREPVNPHLFFVGVSDAREVQKIVEHIATVGMRRISIVHWDDATTTGLVEAIRGLARSRGVEIAGEYPVLPDGRGDLSIAIQEAGRSNASAVISLLAAHETAKLLSGLRAMGSRISIYGPSYNDASLIEKHAEAGSVQGISISQIVPNQDSPTLALAIEFRKHFSHYSPNTSWNNHAFQGYIAARIIVQALMRCSDPKSAECLRRELENTRNHDLGGLVVNYSAENHDGLSYMDIGMISRGGKLLR